MSRELVRDAMLYLPSRLVPGIVALIAIPVVTRLLSLEEYGYYALIINSVALTSSVASSWIVSSAIRFYVPLAAHGLFRILGGLFVASALAGLAMWLAAYAVWSASAVHVLILLGAVLFVAQSTYDVLLGGLRAKSKAMTYSFFSVWRSVVGFVAGVALTAYWGGPAGFLAGLLVASITALPFLFRVAIERPDLLSVERDENTAFAQIVRYGVPALLINLATIGLSVSDRYILQLYKGVEEVGLYSANYDIAEKSVFFINTVFLLSSSVIGFRLWETEGERAALDFVTKITRLYLVVAVPLVAILAVLSVDISAIALPEQYRAGRWILPAVAAGAFMVGIAHRYSILLSFHKNTRAIMWAYALALASNVAINLVLIPAMGFKGAALATLASYAVLLALIMKSASRYTLPAFPWQTFARVTAAVTLCAYVMVVVAEGFRADDIYLSTAASVLSGGIVYIASLLLFGEISPRERKIVVDGIKRVIGH